MNEALILSFIITLIGTSTPLLIAATGELVVEKSGVLNLGVEGMMLMGAVTAFIVTTTSGSPILGVAAGASAGFLTAMIFAFLTLNLSSNQVATGLALTIFGIGLSALIGKDFTGAPVSSFGSPFPPELAQHPQWRVLFNYSPLVYFAIAMVIAVSWFLGRTRAGLILRAVGENDISAHSLGYGVVAVRYGAIGFGGLMAGIAGACFPLMLTPQWQEEITAGRGWIALALVVFASWKPYRLMAGAYLFGFVMSLEVYAKGGGAVRILPAEVCADWPAYASWICRPVPSEALAALPFLATILVLVLISIRRSANTSAPACLGKPFLQTA